MSSWSEKCPSRSLSAKDYSTLLSPRRSLLISFPPPSPHTHTLFTTSSFCCFSLTYPTCLRNASANSHFSFRLLCFTQVLLRCELLFSLNRSWELSFFFVRHSFFALRCYRQAMVVYSQGAPLWGFFKFFFSFFSFFGGEPDGGKERQTQTLSLSSGSFRETEEGGGQKGGDGCAGPPVEGWSYKSKPEPAKVTWVSPRGGPVRGGRPWWSSKSSRSHSYKPLAISRC